MNIDEKRTFERFPAVFPARFNGNNEEFGMKVFLRDASAEGGKILSREIFSLNDTVSIEVKLPDNPHAFTVVGKVVWGRRHQENLWDYGLQFLRIDLVKVARLYNFISPARETEPKPI